MNVRTVGLLVAVLVVGTGLLVGVALAGAGGYLWQDHTQAVESAVPTEATVVSSSVETDLMGSDGPNYRPNVVYEYTVDGETYRSSNVFPGQARQWRSDRSWAREIVADYPEGDTVTAYYDPANPERAFLIGDRRPVLPMILLGIGGLLVVGSLTTGVAALVLYVLLGRKSDDQTPAGGSADK